MITDGLHDLPARKIATIVTHLEMQHPAPMRDVPAPENVDFTPFQPDADRYRDLFTRVGGTDWLWYGRLQMGLADLSRILNDPKVGFYTLRLNGQDEALLELDFRQEGQCELAYFGLTSKLIGSGAGRFLMNKAIALAWQQPITRFHVHTCTLDSPQALSFYIRSGFTPYRQQVEIEDDPRLKGILPEEAAPHVPVFR
ncbi:MAG: GNAT superfamily N-acetyltransferase [Sulfitobacter sp.]|jgi:GNAT superfamily N-acetyltransferase